MFSKWRAKGKDATVKVPEDNNETRKLANELYQEAVLLQTLGRTDEAILKWERSLPSFRELVGPEDELKDTNNQTPLLWAACNGHEAVVKLLLATGQVDADSKDTANRTPLWWAARHGHEAVVKLLQSFLSQ